MIIIFITSKYYVADFGYLDPMGFVPLYWDESYHLQDYHGRGCQPKTYRELFNYRRAFTT